MYKQTFENLGLYVNVDPRGVSQEMKGRTKSFYGKIPSDKQSQLNSIESIDDLVSAHNTAHNDNLKLFYWDNKGHVIFGYVHGDNESYPARHDAAISGNSTSIQGKRISHLVMHREFSEGDKVMPIKSSALPVLQMINCFEHKYFALPGHLFNLSCDERYGSYRKHFGKKSVINPEMTIWYRMDEIDMKRVQKVFPDVIDGKKVLDPSII
jgi:hypothetical protein